MVGGGRGGAAAAAWQLKLKTLLLFTLVAFIFNTNSHRILSLCFSSNKMVVVTSNNEEQDYM